MKWKRYGKYLIIGIIIAISVTIMRPSAESRHSSRDYEEIALEGVLRVTTDYNTRNYHINEQGEADGYHYQLARQFAESHNLQLEIIPLTSIADQDALLRSGGCDIIINGRPSSTLPDTFFRHTLPIDVSKQIIIQRKPITPTDSSEYHIRSQIDLAKRTLTIPADSPFKSRIHHLIEEIGDTIYIREMPQYGDEQLMAMVAHGDIAYAVCDEKTVKANIHQYPQLDNSLALGFNQFYTWLVSHCSPALLDSLNVWIRHIETKPDTPKNNSKR